MTVFEKNSRAGGAFRYAGKAPLFQEVEANERSFARYIADLVAACEMKGVVFRYATDVTVLSGIAGAVRPHRDRERRRISFRPRPRSPNGCSISISRALRAFARLFALPALRDWFYYRARRGTAAPL